MKARASTPSFYLDTGDHGTKIQILESYLDYTKDVGLVKYGADVIGSYNKPMKIQ